MFWGRYKARVDSSKRIVIPKPFRDICGDSVMVSMAGHRLMCYRMKEWKNLEKEHAADEAWWRFITAGSMCWIDGKGRILLARVHIDRSLMRRDVVCAGFVDHFEICSSSSLMDKPR
jgi:division/cell wall cluster transcriptional repressor MraZ